MKAKCIQLVRWWGAVGKKMAWRPGPLCHRGGIEKKGEKTEPACKPDSVRTPTRKGGVLSSHSSGPPVARRLMRPYPGAKDGPSAPLFGLAPGGVYRAAPVTSCAVRSYRTLSPLPAKAGGLLSVALSLGSPPPGVTRHRVSVEPGLSSLTARKRRERSPNRLAVFRIILHRR